jgi:hypothetical protein
MATQDQIFDLRIKISDPPGFIAFSEVDDSASLPATPVSQTAYLQSDTGEYKSTEVTSDAEADDYEVETLSISDSVLSDLIDTYGEASAVCRSIKRIVAQLGNEMRIKKLDGGADSTEYQSLSDLVAYYSELLDIFSDEKASEENADTGRMFKTKAPLIGGGNL